MTFTRSELEMIYQYAAMSTSNGVSAEYLAELHSFMNGTMVVIIAVYPCPNSYKFRENAKEIFDA